MTIRSHLVPALALFTLGLVACGGEPGGGIDFPIEDEPTPRVPRSDAGRGERGGGGTLQPTYEDAGEQFPPNGSRDDDAGPYDASASAPDAGAPAPPPPPPPPPIVPVNPVAACKLDTRAIYIEGSRKIESLTAYGKYWSREVKADGSAAEALGFPHPVTSDPKFAAGPCAGLSSCKLDTRAIFFDGGTKTEWTTANGRAWQWTFDSQGAPVNPGGAGTPLSSVSVFASGPCAGAAAGTCTFGTRTYEALGGSRIETITAYGRWYEFTLAAGGRTPRASSGVPIEAIPRFAAGPCASQPAGACVLDTRTIYVDFDGTRTEEVTARNRLWVHRLSTSDVVLATPVNGAPIVDTARLVEPCKHAMF